MTIPEASGELPDGVYYALPFDDYLALPRLSFHGIQQIGVHPLNYWARSHFNPSRPEPSEEESFAKIMGTAYHTRVIEGRQAFEDRYTARLEADDYPGALFTATDIKAALKDRNIKGTSGKNKGELIGMLLAADPTCEVWDELVADHKAEHPDKIFLSGKALADIEIRARMIEAHPELSKAFTGGLPEVTVLWTERVEVEAGVFVNVPMKARIDYLKARAVVDLKTFSNPLGKPVQRAIVGEIASRKYFTQAAGYLDAANIAADFIKRGQVHDQPKDPEAPARIVKADRRFLFVFQATGPAPIAMGVTPPTMILDGGRVAWREGIETYARNIHHYGTSPWVGGEPIVDLDAAEFPAWTFE